MRTRDPSQRNTCTCALSHATWFTCIGAAGRPKAEVHFTLNSFCNTIELER